MGVKIYKERRLRFEWVQPKLSPTARMNSRLSEIVYLSMVGLNLIELRVLRTSYAHEIEKVIRGP